MLKIQTIVSSHSKVPVAQIRTDGRNIEWIVDNYDLQSHHKDYPSLQAHITSSSDLQFKDDSGPVSNLRNFALSSGDTLSMTDDGNTALLNGRLLTPAQKAVLLKEIQEGRVKVSGEGASLSMLPKPKQEAPTEDFDQSLRDMAAKKPEAKKGSVTYDPEFEEIDGFFAKQVCYYNRYGKMKGGYDAY